MGDECPSGTIHVALLQLNPEHDKTLDVPWVFEPSACAPRGTGSSAIPADVTKRRTSGTPFSPYLPVRFDREARRSPVSTLAPSHQAWHQRRHVV